MSTAQANDRFWLPFIGVVSVLIPLVVAYLVFFPEGGGLQLTGDLSFLPGLNAALNSGVTVLLIAAYIAIRKKKIRLHKTLMLAALTLSVLFLVSYVIYHSGPGHVRYNGTGVFKAIYISILVTHILCSVAVVPLALFSVFRGLRSAQGSIKDQTRAHRRIGKVTLPIWLYVAVTGVVVYLMAHTFNPPA